MAKILGNNLLVGLDGELIAGARECSCDIEIEVKEISSPSTGNARVYIPGRKKWKVSSGQLLSTDDMEKWNNLIGKEMICSFVDKSTVSGVYGNAIVTKLTFNGKRGSISTFSIELTGTGPLTSGWATQKFVPTDANGVALKPEDNILYTNIITIRNRKPL